MTFALDRPVCLCPSVVDLRDLEAWPIQPAIPRCLRSEEGVASHHGAAAHRDLRIEGPG
jgi:hypothetical protein